jgi:hypothetical protein
MLGLHRGNRICSGAYLMTSRDETAPSEHSAVCPYCENADNKLDDRVHEVKKRAYL